MNRRNYNCHFGNRIISSIVYFRLSNFKCYVSILLVLSEKLLLEVKRKLKQILQITSSENVNHNIYYFELMTHNNITTAITKEEDEQVEIIKRTIPKDQP